MPTAVAQSLKTYIRRYVAFAIYALMVVHLLTYPVFPGHSTTMSFPG